MGPGMFRPHLLAHLHWLRRNRDHRGLRRLELGHEGRELSVLDRAPFGRAVGIEGQDDRTATMIGEPKGLAAIGGNRKIGRGFADNGLRHLGTVFQ